MWTGKVSAATVIVLAEHLHLNPHSRCRMIRLGGDIRWIGWDANSEIAAAQYDLVASFGGDKADRFPRPGAGSSDPAETAGELFAPSIAEFNIGAWMSAINGNN